MSIKATKRVVGHPGRILGEYLAGHEMSQSELARRLHVPAGNINEICRGKRGISTEMAFKLSRFFGTTPDLWVNLQKTWEMSLIDPSIADGIKPLKAAA